MTTVSEFEGILAPVKILITSPSFILWLAVSPAATLFLLIFFGVLFKSCFSKAYPSTAEFLKGGKFIFEYIFKRK